MTTSLLTGSYTTLATPAPFNLALRGSYDMFQIVNITDVGSTTMNQNVMRAWGSSLMPAGSAYLNLKNNAADTALALETSITTGGFTFWDSGNPPTFAATTITGTTAADPMQITAAGHGLSVGDTVLLTNLNGTMQPLNGQVFTVDTVGGGGANNFTITFDSSGAVGGTPATAGQVTKVIPSPFSPHRVEIGPTAVVNSSGQLQLRLNTVPSENQLASQYSPFLTPYQPGAYLRLYMPAGFGMQTTANFLLIQVVSLTNPGTYAAVSKNLLTANIIASGNSLTQPTSATSLNAITYPAGAANFKKSFPFVVDIAESASIFSEAEDNAGFIGITVGTGVQTASKLYQWFARRGYTL